MTIRRAMRRAALAAALLAALAAAALVARPDLGLTAWRETSRLRHAARGGWIDAGGVRLHYVRQGEGRPILLVHGLRGESTVLLRLGAALARRGYRVFSIDLPGHGRSPAPSRPLDIAAAGRLVAAAAEVLPLGPRPVVAGHSMGGWIVAYEALAEPERWGGVALISAPGLPFDPPPLPELIATTVEDARASLPALFARPPRYVPGPLLWFAVRRPAHTSTSLLAAALSGRFLLDGLLGGLVPPAVVIFGEQDRLVPPEVGRRMAAEAGAPFVAIPAAGHMVVWERPEAVAETLDRFVREIGEGSAAGSAAE